MANTTWKHLEQDLSTLLESSTWSTLIFMGIGNEFRSDDGAGVALARALQGESKFDGRADLEFIDAGMGLVNYLDRLVEMEPDLLVIADTVRFQGRKVEEGLENDNMSLPGCGLFPLEAEIPPPFETSALSTHQLPFSFIMAFLCKFLPNTRVYLIGLGFETLENSDEMSLSPGVKELIQRTQSLITGLLLNREDL